MRQIARLMRCALIAGLLLATLGAAEGAEMPNARNILYTYMLKQDGTPAAYDEALAVACLQGIINRDGPKLYVVSPKDTWPGYWLDTLSANKRWLSGRLQRAVPNLDALVAMARPTLRGAIIWDPAVPASVNVATTMAGADDAVALSPEMADANLGRWGLHVLKDLRGLFTGIETGSKKNDAYRWALHEFLANGRCSSHLLCLYEDSANTRARGDTSYVVIRDWAVRNRAFVFDLSPWADEKPGDDLNQPFGTDLATYQLILEATMNHADGRHMTELAGFFAFSKYSNMPDHSSRHEPVPTEWETVFLISPYNCYQNTVASDCYNQSLHSHAPLKPLKQLRPARRAAVENKTYICILMADYDSATPLYAFLPKHWQDPARGKTPFAWGINPNLLETYPDIISYFYETATPNDHFTSDASAAGYMNPNRVREESLPLFIRHNERFFRMADMTIAPMVLDWDQPSAEVKDAFTHFSPDGFATIVMDLHNNGGRNPEPQVWKGMPVVPLLNNACNFAGVEQTADVLSSCLPLPKPGQPDFHFFRVVWTDPGVVTRTLDALRLRRPELKIEVVDPYTFFDLFKRWKASHH